MFVTLDYISAFSILVPAIVGTIFYARLFTFAQLLYWFVIFTLVCESLAAILFEYGMNNMFVFHLFSFGEVTLICLIYRNLAENQIARKLILTGFITFQMLSIANLLFFDDITHFNSVQRYFEMAIIYTLLSTFIFRAVNEPQTLSPLKNPAVILTLGFMIYYLGTLFLFVYGNEILTGENKVDWIIHGICNIFLNCIFTLVLLKSRIRFA